MGQPPNGHPSLSTATIGSSVSVALLFLTHSFCAGRDTTNFTTTNRLFLENPHVRYWRFEVVYSFINEISSSALNFVINQPPSNGSCSISPLRGSTSTPFTVSCTGWFDENGIKDYALSGYAAGQDEQTLLAFSSVPDFSLQLPSPNGNETQLNMVATIRDTLDCVSSVNLSTVVVTVDASSITQFVDALANSVGTLATNPLARLLSSGNQNTVAQVIISLSQQLNRIDEHSLTDALSSIGTTLTILSLHSRSPLFRWGVVRQRVCVVAGKCHVFTDFHADEQISSGRIHSNTESVCQCS